jgi:serine/threonine-protein kinase RsbW
MSITRRLVVPADVNHLHQLASYASEAAGEAGFDAIQIGRIELAVDEACSNIIEHAYGSLASGDIDLELQVHPGVRIKIILIDTGRPFNPKAVPNYVPCTPLTEIETLKIGGLGLHLMRQTMDDICFEFGVPGATGPFNRLTMMKLVGAPLNYELDA